MSRLLVAKSSIVSMVVASVLAACDSEPQNTPVTISNGALTQIQLPEILRTVAAIDPTDMQLLVTVNENRTVLERSEDNTWLGVVQVPPNQTSSVFVEWGASYGNADYLKLAEQQKFLFVGTDAATITFDGGYNTQFDQDNDNRTNLIELKQGRSPLQLQDVTVNTDGTFPTGGIVQPFSSECGSQIPIEISTIPPASTDEGAPGTDHAAWWCALLKFQLTDADGNVQSIPHMELTVNVQDNVLFTDSAQSTSHQDDSIEIFIDGDGNKLGPYDGINDYQFRFTPIGRGVVSKRIGPNTPEHLAGEFTYYNGGYQLVAILPLEELGISGGLPFGINVEVNDDDDGGDRDAKYSWIGTVGEDIAWRNTAVFGTAMVP